MYILISIAYVTDTLSFDSLGFTIHDEKSQSEPTQELTYLGIVVNWKKWVLGLLRKENKNLLTLAATCCSKERPR